MESIQFLYLLGENHVHWWNIDSQSVQMHWGKNINLLFKTKCVRESGLLGKLVIWDMLNILGSTKSFDIVIMYMNWTKTCKKRVYTVTYSHLNMPWGGNPGSCHVAQILVLEQGILPYVQIQGELEERCQRGRKTYQDSGKRWEAPSW